MSLHRPHELEGKILGNDEKMMGYLVNILWISYWKNLEKIGHKSENYPLVN